jgi:hypothetical protein
MQCNSLKDLLEILETICTIQDLKNLNKRIKHFEYLRFTFFGLMGRVKTLLGYMLFKAELLKEKYPEINQRYPSLQQLQQRVFEVDSLIKDKEIRKSADKIVEISKEYSILFEEISKLIEQST